MYLLLTHYHRWEPMCMQAAYCMKCLFITKWPKGFLGSLCYSFILSLNLWGMCTQAIPFFFMSTQASHNNLCIRYVCITSYPIKSTSLHYYTGFSKDGNTNTFKGTLSFDTLSCTEWSHAAHHVKNPKRLGYRELCFYTDPVLICLWFLTLQLTLYISATHDVIF